MTHPRFPSTHTGGFRVWLAPLLLAACAPVVAQTPPGEAPGQDRDRGTLQVSGQAIVQVPADRASLSFSVETEAPSARDASRSNAERMDAVIRALRGAGIPGMEIETFGYNLAPEYRVSREDQGGQTITGYRAYNNIRVKLPEVDAAGQVLDLALEAGANRVSNLAFEASDTREARLRALREAVATAREEAEAIAQAMGVRLGPALEVQGGASAPPPGRMESMQMRAFDASVATPIEAGTQMVSASVTITYRILEAGG